MRNLIRSDGDDEIRAAGGSSERDVARWWNALPPSERVAAARSAGVDDADSVLGDWETLAAIGEQMRIHMWRDGVIGHEFDQG